MAQNNLPNLGIFSGEMSKPSGFPNKEDCIYTAHYCEENVWMLIKKVYETAPDQIPFCYAVFISNDSERIPLWRQSASKQEDGLVIWDYHVIMVYSKESACWVFDFDTQLSFPTVFNAYSKETFQEDEFLNPLYRRLFRVIPAEMFLKYFASDRRHMVNDDRTWKMPPPQYSAIRNADEVHNLPQYISMKEEKCTNSISTGKFGKVFNLTSFVARFSIIYNSSTLDYSHPPEPLQPSWM